MIPPILSDALLRLIITLDQENRITFLQMHETAAHPASLQDIAPTAVAPIQEMLALQDVLEAFSLEYRQFVNMIERALGMNLEKLSEQYQGIFVGLDKEDTWGTIFLAWGEKGEKHHQEVYNLLVEAFSRRRDH